MVFVVIVLSSIIRFVLYLYCIEYSIIYESLVCFMTDFLLNRILRFLILLKLKKERKRSLKKQGEKTKTEIFLKFRDNITTSVLCTIERKG